VDTDVNNRTSNGVSVSYGPAADPPWGQAPSLSPAGGRDHRYGATEDDDEPYGGAGGYGASTGPESYGATSAANSYGAVAPERGPLTQVTSIALNVVAAVQQGVNGFVDSLKERAQESEEQRTQSERERAFRDAVQYSPDRLSDFESLPVRKAMFDQAIDRRANSTNEGFEYVTGVTDDPMLKQMRTAASMSDEWDISVKSSGVMFERAGERIFDNGAAIIAQSGSAIEIQGMLDLAESKGWQSIQFSGDDDFKEQAMLAARERGLSVEIPEADLPIFEKVQAALNERAATQTLAKDTLESKPPSEINLPGRETFRQIDISDLPPYNRHGVDSASVALEEDPYRYLATHGNEADAKLDELPVFQPRPTDIVSNRFASEGTNLFAAQQTIEVVGRTKQGDIVGRDGAAFSVISRSAFDEIPKEGDTFVVSRGANGRDLAQPAAHEQEQSQNRLEI
jgi:hypothetical protein